MRKLVELGIFWWKLELWEFWKLKILWLREEGKENREKEKGKEVVKEKAFSLTRKIKILKTRIPELKSSMRENISENTEIVRNSSISERLVNFTKNQ